MLYNTQNAPPELMGIFGLSWKEKVSSRAAPGSGWSAGDFNRNFDLLYGTYKIAVAQKGYAPYDRAAPDGNLFSFINQSTAIETGKIIFFLNALYNATKAGDIKPEYLNPAAGQAIAQEKTAATVAAVKRFLAPAGAAVSAGPVSSITNKLLVAAVALGLGYFLIPKLAKGAAGAKAKKAA